ncbi:MAG: FprA family A-type flavoprotein [Bacteroidales bacterium]
MEINTGKDKRDDKVLKVTDDVTWIGVLDYDIVTFDIVMHTEFGTTYNSYFINAEKKTVIEAAKKKFSDVHINKLRSLTDPSEIQYIVLDHTEPDHSGNIGDLLELAPEATVVGSGNAIRYLADIINKPFKSLIVKDGDTLDLGNKTLQFVSAPNLHWPDSMFTYLVEDKVLFTCDFFGAHYCSDEMINDFSDDYLGAYKYYFDVIIKPFSRFAARALEKIAPLGIKTICPGHGPIHFDNIEELVTMTGKYANNYLAITSIKEVKNIMVMYISAYGYTRTMAEQIANGIKSVPNMNVSLLDIEDLPLGELESEVVRADAMLVGSPTINQNTLLPVYRLFSVINPIRDRAKVAGSFGSYGWSGEAPRIINDTMKNLKIKVFEEQGLFKFYPGEDKEAALVEFGKKFAEFVTAECYQKL